MASMASTSDFRLPAAMNSSNGPLIIKPTEEEFGIQEVHVMHQSMPMASSRGRRRRRSKPNTTRSSSSSSSSPTIMNIISTAILFTSSCLSISSYSAANAQQSATAVTSTPRFKSPTAYHHRNSAHKLKRKLARRTRQEQQQQQQRTLQSQTICSCAPRSFTITLDLLNNCFDDTIQSNVGGINETDCTIQFGDEDDFDDGMGGIEGIVGGGMSIDDDDNASGDGNISTNSEIDLNDSIELHVNRPTTINGLKPETLAMINEILADIPWLTNTKGTINKEEEKPMHQKKQNRSEKKHGEREPNRNIQKGSNRHLQGPATPIVINSVSFIEVNSLGVVINVEIISTNVEFTTGSSFEITSVSSLLSTDIPIEDQLDFIPDTSVLFLVGTNSQGEEVRGRFVWRYTNSCSTDAVAIQEGDVLAWNEWSEVEDQLGEFCPANGGGITSAPVPVGLPTNSPVATLNPSAGPTLEPTPMAIPFPTFLPTSLPTIAPSTSFPTLMPTTDPVTATPSTAPNTPLPTMMPTESPTMENSPTQSPTMEDNPTRGPSSYTYSRPTFMSMPLPSNGNGDSNTFDDMLNYFETSSDDISSTHSGSSSSSSSSSVVSSVASSSSSSKSSRKGHAKSGKRKKMKRQNKRNKSGKTSSEESHFVSGRSSSISSSKNGKRNKARSKGKRSSERSSSDVRSRSSSSSSSSSISESSGSSGRSHRSSSGSNSAKSTKKR